MEPKKTVRADLTRMSFLFFNIGLVVSLSLTIVAFTYKSEDTSTQSDLSNNQAQVEETLDVPVTEQLPPPPPKIEQPSIVEVKNNVEVEEELNVDMDAELDLSESKEEVQAVAIEEEEEDPNTIFTIVEESAMPVGGINAFNEYVSRNIIYPTQAKRMGIEGKVFVEFVIEKDGSITDVKTIKGIGGGCDEEAVRILRKAPKWNPGKQRGKAVRQKMVVPLNFVRS
jgi:periplasmic protein TonB